MRLKLSVRTSIYTLKFATTTHIRRLPTLHHQEAPFRRALTLRSPRSPSAKLLDERSHLVQALCFRVWEVKRGLVPRRTPAVAATAVSLASINLRGQAFGFGSSFEHVRF